MRFLVRKEQVATEEGNRASFQNAVALREQISARIETNRFQRQSLVTEVKSLNTQMENNVRQFNAQEAARVEQLNEQRRQSNLDRLQSVSMQIGELAQNPADVGKLAAFLRSGNLAAISGAIARGENAITDESLLGLRGLLGVREGLQQGPRVATGNFIDAALVDVPRFDTPLGEAPDVADLFQEIQFDSKGIARGASPVAGDLGGAFGPIQLPPEIEAMLVGQPPEVQAQLLNMPEFAAAIAAAQPPAQPQPPAAGAPAAGPPAQQAPPQQQVPVGPPSAAAPGFSPPSTDAYTPNNRIYDPANPGAYINPDGIGSIPGGGQDVRDLAKKAGLPQFVIDKTPPEHLKAMVDGIKKRPIKNSAAPTTDLPQDFGDTGDINAGFEFGGIAAPGMPVIVGDSSDGKENQELAMVDANGNLVVVPVDRLPRAEEGGVFGQFAQPAVMRPVRDPRGQRRRRGQGPRSGPGQGFPTFGDPVRPGR